MVKLTSSLFIIFIAFSAKKKNVEPIRIGTTQSLTGHYSEFGEQQLRGLQMWAAVIEEAPLSVDNPADLEAARRIAAG